MPEYQRKQTSFELNLAIKPHFSLNINPYFNTDSMRLADALTANDMRMRENDVTLEIPKSSYAKRLPFKGLTINMGDTYLTSIKRGRCGRHGVHMNNNLSCQNYLTSRYRSNTSIDQTDPYNQNIHVPGQRDLLINEKNVFVITNTCMF